MVELEKGAFTVEYKSQNLLICLCRYFQQKHKYFFQMPKLLCLFLAKLWFDSTRPCVRHVWYLYVEARWAWHIQHFFSKAIDYSPPKYQSMTYDKCWYLMGDLREQKFTALKLELQS